MEIKTALYSYIVLQWKFLGNVVLLRIGSIDNFRILIYENLCVNTDFMLHAITCFRLIITQPSGYIARFNFTRLRQALYDTFHIVNVNTKL